LCASGAQGGHEGECEESLVHGGFLVVAIWPEAIAPPATTVEFGWDQAIPYRRPDVDIV